MLEAMKRTKTKEEGEEEKGEGEEHRDTQTR
jgi:hypothetical protein